MIFMAIMLAVAVYIAIAVAFVLYVWRRTKRKLDLWLAIVLVILLPTWDVVLGYIVYYPACLFIPKTAIYETAETDGIYYEGGYNNFLLDLSERNHNMILNADEDFKRGYKYVESLVTETGTSLKTTKVSPPKVYRCDPIPFDSHYPHRLQIDCTPAKNVHSAYTVHSAEVKCGLAEIRFVKISERSSGKIMAEHNEVVRWINNVPFFLWMNMGDGSSSGVSCPEKSRYYDFHYDVLRPKK